MNYKTAKGYLFAVLSAVIYGSMPLMAKYIYADGVTPMTLVFLRNLFAIVPLALLAYRQKKTLKVPKELLPSIGLISLFGCCITPTLLFSSYQFIASGTATVIHFSYPAMVVIAQILFLKKKVMPASIVSVVLCVLGVSLFYSPQETLNFTGSALALLSGVTFATYVILLSRFDSSKVSGFLFGFYVTVVSTVAAFIICLVSGNLVFPVSPLGWGLCIVFSLMVTVGAVVLFQQSTFLIGGERASILSTLEPITSLVIGVIVFREALSSNSLIGSALVVAASILTALADIKKNKKEA